MHTVHLVVNEYKRMAFRFRTFEVEAMVRGYHQYKDIWEAEFGERLECQREIGNPHDIFAVAVMKAEVVVGHIPMKISSICSLFIRRGGAIHCAVVPSVVTCTVRTCVN